jgi:hypothetical protein
VRAAAWLLVVVAADCLIAAGTVVAASVREPAIVIVCEVGGVGRIKDEGLLGSGASCVGHDRKGGTFTAASISVYDDGFGP